jgi:hypothetical protein
MACALKAYPWVELPETFTAKLELPGRVDTAPGLMFGARRLLLQMGGWLVCPPLRGHRLHPALVP